MPVISPWTTIAMIAPLMPRSFSVEMPSITKPM